MLAGLFNASAQLEDPFDGDGVDDLNMEMIREPTFLMFHRTRKEVNKMLKKERKEERKRQVHSESQQQLKVERFSEPTPADAKHAAMEKEKASLRREASN